MSVYKVPQDVEADDKLLGPFNFRQVVYLLVAGGLILLAVFLFGIFPGLIIIPAPFIILLLVLALPIKKDQPMEMYLAAVVAFALKPNKRIWTPDGIEHLVEISAPIREEKDLTKGLSQDETARRFSYLADIVDTEGWAIKNAVSQEGNFKQDFIAETNSANDIFENRASKIDSMLENSDNFRKQQIMQNINTARNLADYTNSTTEQIQAETYKTAAQLYEESKLRAQQPQNQQYISWNQSNNQQNSAPSPSYTQTFQQSFPQQTQQPSPQIQHFINPSDNSTPNPLVSESESNIHYNPYPDSIHQSVILPIGQQHQDATHAQQSNKSAEIDPNIARLVSEGKDLSVETIARQAKKIKQNKEIDLKEEEIVISLR